MRPSTADPGMTVARPAEPARPLIIERAHLQTAAQRYGYLSVTFAVWFLWLYLVLPLLSLIAWALGATLVYQVMLLDLETAQLVRILKSYGTGAGILTGIYLAWAITSYLRFRHVRRRRGAEVAGDAALAASHRLSETELRALREGARQVVSAELLLRMFAPEQANRAENEAPARTRRSA